MGLLGQILGKRRLPVDENELCKLGNAYLKSNRLDEAIEIYKQVLDINPLHATAWSNFGIALQNSHQIDLAISVFKKATSIDPAYANAWHNLGYAYFIINQYTEAEAAFKQAVHIDPDHSSAQHNLKLCQDKIEEQHGNELAIEDDISGFDDSLLDWQEPVFEPDDDVPFEWYEPEDCMEGLALKSEEVGSVAITDQEFYKELVRRKMPTRLCCDICGSGYRFENMSMCKYCASVVCYRCVWDPNMPNQKRTCQCGGEFD